MCGQDIPSPITLAEYLYFRLAQLGVQTVHGSAVDIESPIVQAASKANITYVGSINEGHAGWFTRVKKIDGAS